MYNRLKDEQGFTLIELLVVILIIGILAAIALPTFVNQQRKGQDASAKSDARNLATHMETCFADSQTYVLASCTVTNASTGLQIGGAVGQVNVVPNAAIGYAITARSKGGCDFVLTKSATGTARTATVGSNCPTGGTW